MSCMLTGFRFPGRYSGGHAGCVMLQAAGLLVQEIICGLDQSAAAALFKGVMGAGHPAQILPGSFLSAGRVFFPPERAGQDDAIWTV